jgi:hypothetical protein
MILAFRLLGKTAMLGFYNRRSTLFLVARSHDDLCWYLSVKDSRQAANDACAHSVHTPLTSKPRKHLELVNTGD